MKRQGINHWNQNLTRSKSLPKPFLIELTSDSSLIHQELHLSTQIREWECSCHHHGLGQRSKIMFSLPLQSLYPISALIESSKCNRPRNGSFSESIDIPSSTVIWTDLFSLIRNWICFAVRLAPRGERRGRNRQSITCKNTVIYSNLLLLTNRGTGTIPLSVLNAATTLWYCSLWIDTKGETRQGEKEDESGPCDWNKRLLT